MTHDEAKQIAAEWLKENESLRLDELAEKTDFGYLFSLCPRNSDEILAGVSGVIVERDTGVVHTVGSGKTAAYWLEAYEKGLHEMQDVIVVSVKDRQRAAFALKALRLSHVVEEVDGGTVWKIPQEYTEREFRELLENLPVRFKDQKLLFRLEELKRIEDSDEVEIKLETSLARSS